MQNRGNFIAGEFRQPVDPNGEWEGRSPADLDEVTGTFSYSYEDIDAAVDSARAAFSVWRKTSFEERAGYLKKYAEIVKRREIEFSEAISLEMGKPLWESKTEVGAMVGKVAITLNESMKQVEAFDVEKAAPGANGACRFRAMGVMAVIGPFNFPGHLPNGHIIPALATGNTVVFKPSEKTPLVGQLMAECFEEVGLPPGVFNLVQGEREVGRRLCVHEGVHGILFTGSYEVGTRIKQDTLQQHWKILALEMGGKNSALVWEDADLDVALREVFVGAYITTGQRCSCTSRVFVHEKLFDAFLGRFHERAKSFQIGHPRDNPFMGPLIDSGTVDRYMKFMGIADREGCEMIMRGKALGPGEGKVPRGHYVTPSICWFKDSSLEAARKSVYQQTEIFSPNVALIRVSDLDEAVALSNATQYGLAASVFTRSRETYHHVLDGLEAGVINWNKSTVGASSKLPFGGVKKSGNHFPTALTATRYCTYPVASLEVENPDSAAPNFPGLNWS